jgi:hypothetical protein
LQRLQTGRKDVTLSNLRGSTVEGIFSAWLAEQPDDAVAGEACSTEACPLARCLSETLGMAVRVRPVARDALELVDAESGATRRIRSRLLCALAAYIDEQPGPVSVARARKVWDALRELAFISSELRRSLREGAEDWPEARNRFFRAVDAVATAVEEV